MAEIGRVELQIAHGDGYGEMALVEVEYQVSASAGDMESATAYHEVVQLYVEGQGRLGHPQETPVAGGLLYDGITVFTADAQSFVHGPEKLLPLSVLEPGIGPFTLDEVRARVTMTPLPASAVSRASNAVVLHRPPVLDA
jgi:hypothetical protein